MSGFFIRQQAEQGTTVTFRMDSAKAHITDPCYERGTWCANFDVPILAGVWNAYPIMLGGRVAQLIAYHESFPNGARWDYDGDMEAALARGREMRDLGYSVCKLAKEVGVDSGQAGIFADSIYPQGEVGGFDEEGSFYNAACTATLGEQDAQGNYSYPNFGTVMGAGVVSSTGWGDGSYDAYGITDKDGNFIQIVIDYGLLGEDEEDEDEEDVDDPNDDED